MSQEVQPCQHYCAHSFLLLARPLLHSFIPVAAVVEEEAVPVEEVSKPKRAARVKRVAVPVEEAPKPKRSAQRKMPCPEQSFEKEKAAPVEPPG